MKKIKKKKKLIIICLIIMIIVITVIKNNASKSIEEKKIETEKIEKRTISQSISATGTITTDDNQTVISTLSGTEVATVNVTEGQKIEVGDVICTFDMSTVESNFSNAKSTANISNAQSDLSIQAAQRNLDDAVKNRDSQIVGAQTEVAATQKAYEDAQNQLNTLTNSIAANQSKIATLNANISEIQSELAKIPNTDATYVELNNKISSMTVEIETLNTEIAGLQAQVAEMQPQVNNLKTAFDTAVSNLNKVTSAADSNVASMQDSLKSAELTAQSGNIAQSNELKTYEDQLEKGIVTATVSGVVTSVGVKVGDIYAGGNIATIEGNEQFIIESEIDEYDIADVEVGMKVLIKTDSTRDEELEGKVIYVSPSATVNNSLASSATTNSGSATYKIKISLDTPNDRLRLGMNAKLSIIAEQKEAVWSVPYNAVSDREDGTKYITILKDETTEETEEIDVTTGIEGAYYIEIISDKIHDGMKVVLPDIENDDTVEALLQAMGADGGI